MHFSPLTINSLSLSLSLSLSETRCRGKRANSRCYLFSQRTLTVRERSSPNGFLSSILEPCLFSTFAQQELNGTDMFPTGLVFLGVDIGGTWLEGEVVEVAAPLIVALRPV